MTTFFPKPLDKQVAAISDSVSQTQDGLAIVANGDTHAAISSGQFVYVKNHDTLAEGLYKANSAIDTNGALSTSNLTPDGTGGLNDLQGQVTALNSNLSKLEKYLHQLIVPGNGASVSFPFTRYGICIIIGLAQGQGPVCVIAQGGNTATIKNIFDGTTYSGSRIAIASNTDNNALVFTNSYTQASSFLIISTGY